MEIESKAGSLMQKVLDEREAKMTAQKQESEKNFEIGEGASPEEAAKKMHESFEQKIGETKNDLVAQMQSVKNTVAEFISESKEVGGQIKKEVAQFVGLSAKMEKNGRLNEKDQKTLFDLKDKGAIKTITSETGGSGVALVGEEVARTIIALAGSTSSLFGIAQKVITSAQEYRFVVETNSGTNGAYYDENTAGTVEDINFSPVKFTLKRWAKFVGIANRTLQTSETESIGAFIIRNIANAYERFHSAQLWSEISGSTTVSVYTMGSGDTDYEDITLDDIANARALVPASKWGRMVLVVSPSVFGVLEQLKDDNGRPLLDSNALLLSEQVRGTAGVRPAAVLGGAFAIPIIVDDALPATSAASQANTKFAALVEVDAAIGVVAFNDVEIGQNTSIQWTNDNTVFRGQNYSISGVVDAKGVVVLRTAAN